MRHSTAYGIERYCKKCYPDCLATKEYGNLGPFVTVARCIRGNHHADNHAGIIDGKRIEWA